MKFGFIGLGNMGRAIASGLIQNGAVKAEDIIGFAPRRDRLNAYCAETGITPMESARAVAATADVVVMAVKPYILQSVLDDVRDLLENKVVLSIALGWDHAKLKAQVPDSTRVQFIMPNTPALVGKGVLVFEATNSLNKEERAEIMEKFATLGAVEELPTHLMGIGGTISGCGPAFTAMIIEALGDAGVKYGLPRAQAYRLASLTLEGTARLQLDTDQHPGVLKDAVCSPAGSTIRGVEALEKEGLRAAILACIQACVER